MLSREVLTDHRLIFARLLTSAECKFSADGKTKNKNYRSKTSKELQDRSALTLRPFSDQDSIKKHCLGGSREWGTPVPIPNTEVKPLFADVTYAISIGKVGRRQDSAF